VIMNLASSPSSRPSDRQRGVSLSVFACGAIVVLLIVAGLVVDGAAQVSAHVRAEGAAAAVARYAMDAAAPYLIDGQDGAAPALTAARSAARSYSGLQFDIFVDAGGALHVTTRTTVATTFLQLIGIRELTATGDAVAQLYPPQ